MSLPSNDNGQQTIVDKPMSDFHFRFISFVYKFRHFFLPLRAMFPR